MFALLAAQIALNNSIKIRQLLLLRSCNISHGQKTLIYNIDKLLRLTNYTTIQLRVIATLALLPRLISE